MSVQRTVRQYTQLRTIPALLSVFYVIASLYAFGGISAITFQWVGYTLDNTTALLGSLLVFALAFASSETKEFQYYSQAEQILIAAGPAVMLLNFFLDPVSAFVMSSMVTQISAFAIVTISWGVAVQ